MASYSCITREWANAAPNVRLTLTESSYTETTSTMSWTLEYIASSPASTNSNRTYEVYIDGDLVKSGSYNINGKKGTYTIASGTKTLTRSTYDQSIQFGVYFAFKLSWGGKYTSTESATSSFTLYALKSYTIKYNANGGSGAPSSQTKWYGKNLTISNTKPTRTGHTFKGWALTASGGVYYTPGSTCGKNENLTLYAVWQAHTYTVSYNANGGSGAPDNQTKTYGKTLTLSNTKPTRTHYNFLGWGTSASSTTVSYNAGGSYVNNAAATLYAVWELAYIAPQITNFSVDRCDSGGVLSEEGTYALVKFDWKLDTNRKLSSIKIEWKKSDSSTYEKNKILTVSGTSGSVSEIIGNAEFDTEYAYNIRIMITDDLGNSVKSANIAPMEYIIDFLSGGGGIAFGKPAKQKGADFGTNIILQNDININTKLSNGTECILVGTNPKDQFFFGFGSREESVGASFFDGNEVYIRSNSNINMVGKAIINGCAYEGNKVLWSGGWFMTAGDTATLSEPVSKQPNGIVLVFSHYSSNENHNYHWNTFFIPKYMISKYAGGYSFNIATNGVFTYVAAKYLYLYDTKITGNDYNGQTGTGTGGVEYVNNNYVLRYVIGV